MSKQTDAEHIQAIVSGLSRLGCSNHSCYFSPPKGVGTNGGCSCLSDLPSSLRVALIRLWIAHGQRGDSNGN